MKLLSIVIPVFNRGDVVETTLDSIITQRRINEVDIIIVDNNSTDNSLSVITKWKERNSDASIQILSQTTPGAAAARNAGVESVTTPWILHFDSDDIMHQGLIADLLDAIAIDDAEVIGWPIRQQLLTGKWGTGRFNATHIMRSHFIDAALSTQRYAARTSLIRDAGGWDKTLRGWDDYELGVRLLLLHPRIKMLNGGVRVTTIFSDASITGTNFSHAPAKWEHSLDLCYRHLIEARQPATIINVRRAILAANYAREGHPELAESLRQRTLSAIKSRRHRLLWHFLYQWQRLIGRGTARISLLLGVRLPH